MAPDGQRRIYASGRWEVDLARRELRMGGVPVPVGGRVFDITEVLAQAAGELVAKDVLMARVWPGVTVDEGALRVHMSALRKALGPDRDMLKTDLGRGYRLLGNWAIRWDIKSEHADDRSPARLPVSLCQSNLPLQDSDFIGQAAAVQRVRDLVSAARAVTLTGPGGIGKTRLANEVARSLLPGFQDNVFLIELASLADGGPLTSSAAGVLGLELDANDNAVEATARAIGERKLLLVLDNCEHVIDAVATLAETILRICPRASVLATSRERLRINGEYVYRVPPLDIPPQQCQEPKAVLEHSAVQLFIARTTALSSDFPMGRESLLDIATICRRLDGIPLAIELAAARAATLGAKAVLSGLDDRFKLLGGGRRTALPRHQTLRATLDWSYALLPEPQRRLLRHLAVFAGGFTLDAAEAVGGGSELAAAHVTEEIADLVSKSLIILDRAEVDARWRLLETTRAYALEKLVESGESEAAAQRHARFFQHLFARPPVISALQPNSESIAHHVTEIDNIRAALDWAFSPTGDMVLGATLTAAYVPVWLRLSLLAECRERVEQALFCLDAEDHVSSDLRMRLHIAFGTALLHWAGSTEWTESVLTRALEVAEGLDDANAQLQALWAIWTCRFNNGDNLAAQAVADRFSSVARRTGDAADLLVGERLMANTLHYSGRQPEARARLERVLKLYVPPRDQRHVTWFLYDQRQLARARLARVLLLQGLIDQAGDTAQASLKEAEAADHKMSICYALGNAVCPIALMVGDLDAAARSETWLNGLVAGDRGIYWKSWGACLRGVLLIRRGEFLTGTVLLRDGLRSFNTSGSMRHTPDFLGALAEGLAGTGQLVEALETIDQALTQAERDGRRWGVAELYRIKGELLQIQPTTGQALSAAEACFLEALETASQQGAVFWELKVATSLARLWHRQQRNDAAWRVLAAIHGRCTEGFDTPHVRSASALLEQLAPRRDAEGYSLLKVREQSSR